MAFLKRKISARRSKLRQELWEKRLVELDHLTKEGIPGSAIILAGFIVAASIISSLRVGEDVIAIPSWAELLPISALTLLIATAMAVYIFHYHRRVIKNNMRGAALAGMFLVLLVAAKTAMLFSGAGYIMSIATGTIVTCAIILTIAYDQRFAIAMSLFYSIMLWLGVEHYDRMDVFVVMTAGVMTCCFCLKEIRTRMKLIEVIVLTAAMVFITAGLLGALRRAGNPEFGINAIFQTAGSTAFTVLMVGLIINGLLPVIEKVFKVATSMTLLDYSDASQPLLKRLALEAPGTYSHSLLIGSLAEAAAESIGANGLLCRVGSYYHDIGKIHKPGYFVENQMGAVSRHKELSPAMSQLVIVGHVKDGIEMAREYNLPAVLRQFVETHHGTTLIEYFYNEAKKREHEETTGLVSESDFRYGGPRPKSKEAAIVMLADSVEGAVRSLSEISPARIDAVVHNMAMKRLQDGQFDECDLTLRELSRIEASLSKSLAAHYHGRIAYPKAPPERPHNGGQGESFEKIS